MESPFLEAHGLLKYIGLFLGGVCHQLPEHSIFIAGVQLPLCARCTGTYLGTVIGLVNLWWRGRSHASWLPPVRMLAVLVLFFAFWAIDGVNSYFNYLSGHVILYVPSNLLRLASGMVNGLSLSILVFPMFNFILWRNPERQRVVRDFGELTAILLQVVALVLVLRAGIGVLLYPFVLLNLVGVLTMLTIVNGMIVIILLRRENRAESRRQALLPLGLGLLLSIAEVGSIATLRYVLAPALVPPTL